MLEGAEGGKKNNERRSAERLSLYAKVHYSISRP